MIVCLSKPRTTVTNVLAAYGNVEYDQTKHEPRGQMDLCNQGLKMADLLEPPP